MKRTRKASVSKVSPELTPDVVVKAEAVEVAPIAVAEVPAVVVAAPILAAVEEVKNDMVNGAVVEEARSVISLRVTASLKRKLVSQSQEEGVSLQDYVSELLSEGVVLRAWEIVEKKAQMRGVAPQGSHGQHNRNNHNSHGGNHPQGNRNNHNGGNKMNGGGAGGGRRGGMNQARYNNLMEDKAAFLEYVRNQERKQR